MTTERVPRDRPIRVAFTVRPRARWAGGYYYLLNLVGVIQRYLAGRIEPVVFAGAEVPPPDLAPFRKILGADLVVDPRLANADSPRHLLTTLATGRDRIALDAYRNARIDVVFAAAAYFGWRFPLPTVLWIADFQHRWLPQMFGKATIYKRELAHTIQLRSCGSVMLSSESARRDLTTFFPRAAAKSIAVPFAVMAPDPPAPLDAAALREKYRLPEKFFYLPNTFWKHKNHRVVCEALALLQAEGKAPVVAASGDAVDHRHPRHFAELEEFVRAHGIEDAFRFIGSIPYPDLVGLMRASTAVINPSLFEGWSTTVEEAKSYGAPLILSDIPVHREQARPDTRFFDPASPAELARVLDQAIRELPAGPRPEAERAGARQSERDTARFAERFADAVARALSS